MRVYRPAGPVVRTFGFLAVLSACLFVFFTATLALAELKPGEQWASRIVVMTVLGALAIVSLGLWIYLLTQKIVIRGLWITFIGPICKRTIHLRDVTRVCWRKNDSVTLFAGRNRQSDWFGSYRVEDAADLVKLIRNNVPAALHEGWHPFYQARMKGRLDQRQLFLLRHPHANPNPQPIKVGRLMVRSLTASLIAALVVWARIAWELRNVTDPPRSNFTGNWLFDCLMIAALANVPLLLLIFAERLRLRRQRQTWATTGIEFV